ncbi:MAG: DUF3990 domain-containing protein [Candidatus Ornithomonoglobus sp.]
MIVYHGSIEEIRLPKILRAEVGRDFGFAFYTTDIKEQAERWAIRKAKILNRRKNNNYYPVVNVYNWSNYDYLNIKSFTEANGEWLDMILNCRSDISYIHSYDIVIGKIADDSVGETVSYVMNGIMRREDAIERLKFEKINNQIAFCSEESLKTISFLKSYIVKEA